MTDDAAQDGASHQEFVARLDRNEAGPGAGPGDEILRDHSAAETTTSVPHCRNHRDIVYQLPDRICAGTDL
ncbi:hypothetical protein [Methylobacterium phyllostachyos]|uniref:hypothetical protein n=1 Tax=Methylobacterium phyllostachyos TaxID=582672 RepID=UPI00115F94DF|nr:hypothetical protein [Methylobacterium phyllostachyos]